MTKIIFLAIALNCFTSDILLSEIKYKNYKNYTETKTQFNLEKITENVLQYPWGMSFVDNENLLITEKNGRLVKVNVSSGKIKEIKHNIQSIKYKGKNISYGQGGLLDVLNHENYVYFSYSHDHGNKTYGKSNQNLSTAIARGILSENEIKNLEILLISESKININKHFGSRIVIKDNHLFAGFGDRGKGMIAQDSSKHPGSIIRIKIDGTLPEDNPSFKEHPSWLPELYLIGIRNSQGITISPHDKEIYFTQHGPMGGDNIGRVKYASNFGWKEIAWGGKEYSGFKIGNKPFKDKYEKPIFVWVPSIGIGNLKFYKGEEFSEWEGDLLISATKANMLFRLDYENDSVVKEEFIIKNNVNIKRIRDFEIDRSGNIYLISDDKNSALWKISSKKEN